MLAGKYPPTVSKWAAAKPAVARPPQGPGLDTASRFHLLLGKFRVG